MKRITEHIFLLVLLIPLLFTNIKSSHDWGDDFAQYIHQAKNINDGISQNETGYVFNKDAFIGPKAYPTGFPLLLAPVVYYYGVNYEAINVYLSVFLLLSCFIGYVLLRTYFSAATAMIVTLIIAYNPVTLNFKTEILSDIPFLFFSLLTVLLVLKKESTGLSILIGCLLGFCFHIRSITLVLLLSIVIYRIITLFKENRLTLSSFKFTLFTLISFCIVFLLINNAWPTESSYPRLFETEEPFLKAINHLSYQNEEFHRFFRNYESKDYFIILCMAASSLTCFTWLGFFHQLKHNRFGFFNIYIVLYVMALVVYAYSDTGIRFLFPVMFILFYYAIIGFKNALKEIIRNTFWLPYIIGFCVLFSYSESWQHISGHEKDILEGPESTEAAEMFAYIKKNIPENSIIAFDKPRALSLYTRRSGVCLKYENTMEELRTQLDQFKASYFITHTLLTSQINRSLAQDSALKLQLVFENTTSKIYKNTNL